MVILDLSYQAKKCVLLLKRLLETQSLGAPELSDVMRRLLKVPRSGPSKKKVSICSHQVSTVMDLVRNLHS